MTSRIALVLTLATVATSFAHAANVVVQKNGQFPTIQSGINAAGPNGTVTVKAGVYEETPSIPASADGLTLKASGNVIIDARLANGAADGPGITCAADDVTIRGFTIRHPQSAGAGKPGVGIRVTAPGALIEKVKIVNCSGEGILVETTDTVIRNCTVTGVGYGVYASTANNTVVEQCTITQCTSYGIYINGLAPTARKNVVKHCNGYGISLSGPNAIAEKNVVSNTDSTGIYVSAVDAIIRANKVDTTFSGNGINSSGDGAEIESNNVTNSRYEGIYASGSQLTLRKNRVRTSSSNEEGIYVSGGLSLVVESNVVEDAGTYGISMFGDASTVRKNRVLRAGRYSSSSAGYYLSGNGGTIEANVAKDCMGDGFTIYSSNADVLNNTATGNAIDGFDVNGSNCEVRKNVATKNSGEGFDLSGSMLTFENNTAKNNRIDVAASAMLQSFQDNIYGTGGANVTPEID